MADEILGEVSDPSRLVAQRRSLRISGDPLKPDLSGNHQSALVDIDEAVSLNGFPIAAIGIEIADVHSSQGTEPIQLRLF